MASYKVISSVRPRRTPSMYETDVLPNLTIGFTFDSSVVQSLIPSPPIVGQDGAITWVQLPNTYWVPLKYKGVEYVKDITVTPPPPSGPRAFTLSVEGYLPYNGTLTPDTGTLTPVS